MALKRIVSTILFACLFAGVFTHHVSAVTVTGTMQPIIKVYDGSGMLMHQFLAYPKAFHLGLSVSTGDVDGDGQLEVVTTVGRGGGPEIKIFRLDGAFVNSFIAYDANIRCGISSTVYDLDSDGKSEIITAPDSGCGPEVKVFHSDGTLWQSFFAYDRDFRGGVQLAAGPFGRNGEPMIITASGTGGAHIRGFRSDGTYSGLSLFPYGKTANSGIVLTSIPFASSRPRLAIVPLRTDPAIITEYSVNGPAKKITSFRTYPNSMRNGIRLTSADVDGKGEPEIIVASGPDVEPRMKVFSLQGKLLRTISPYRSTFRGGISVAASSGLIVTAPRSSALEGRLDYHKYIAIDLSDQTLKNYEDGKLLGTHDVSTGKWKTPTPVGTFAIKNKIPVAYSKPYDLYMEWWMAFTPDGSYGLHALPYWKKANGAKLYEGVGHLGTPVSHGCIRQSLSDAIALYRWAEIGTPVVVSR